MEKINLANTRFEKITHYLNFLSLIDKEGKLSISNLAVLVVLAKLIFSPSESITEAGTLFTVIGNYAYKRYVNSQPDQTSSVSDDVKSQLDEVKSQVNALSLSQGINKR